MTQKTEAQEAPAPAIVRTSAGLRDAIFDEIDAIRNGRSNPTRANAVAKLATGVVETVRMEMEVHRHLRSANPKNSQPGVTELSGMLLGSQMTAS